jgi:hypothetical protein
MKMKSDPVYDALDGLIENALDIIHNSSKDEEAYAWGVIMFTSKFNDRAFRNRVFREVDKN